jgi:beta-1,4-N-acetylglucosaminyltransferase
MIFITVGSEYPFDRLIRAMDELIENGVIQTGVFAQIGHGRYLPRNMGWAETITRSAFEKKVADASGVIAHAGMGTILSCLKAQKPLLVVPRLKKYGEIVSDHQVATAKKFESLNYLLAAYDEKDLSAKVDQLRSFSPPRFQHGSSGVIERVRRFLEGLSDSGR